jgi:hypothetical protein
MEIKALFTKQLNVNLDYQIKKHDEQSFLKLITSTQRHGQLHPVDVILSSNGTTQDEDGYNIVSNFEVVRAHQYLGIEQTYCIIRKDYTEALMSLLEREIRFETDYFKAATIIEKLNSVGVPNRRIQHSTPWSEKELNNMLNMKHFDWENFGEPDESLQVSLF